MKNNLKKISKKELEASLTDKFMHAVAELGHDSDKLKRVIKKASKFIAKKIERKLKDVKQVVEAKMDSAPVKNAVIKAEKSSAAAKKDIAKKAAEVEKVIAKATKTATKKVVKTVEKPVLKAAKAVEEVKAAVSKPAPAKAKPAVAKPVVAAKVTTPKAKPVKK